MISQLRLRSLFGGLVVISLTALGGAPANKLKSTSLHGPVLFNLKGDYHHPVFSAIGQELIVAKPAKYSGIDPSNQQPQEFDVDEIWRVNLKTGKMLPIIEAAEFKGRIGSQALLTMALLEDSNHLHLEFKDADIGVLTYTIDLASFSVKRWRDTSEDDGHDEVTRSPDEIAAEPEIAKCFDSTEARALDEFDWRLFVVPHKAAYVQQPDVGGVGKPEIWHCDFRTHQSVVSLSRPASWRGDMEGGAYAGSRALLALRASGNLELYSGDVQGAALVPTAVIAGPADYFIFTPAPHAPDIVAIEKMKNWKRLDSALYRFDGKSLLQYSGLSPVINADLSPDGTQLAVTLQEGDHTRIAVYKFSRR